MKISKRFNSRSTLSAIKGITVFSILSLTLSSGIYSAWLASQPHLEEHQVHVLETGAKICYGGSTSIFSIFGAKKLTRRKRKNKLKGRRLHTGG